MTLNNTDILRIKKEMSPGNLVSVGIMLAIFIFDLVQVLTGSMDWKTLLIINIAGFILAFAINIIFNSKYRKDLKSSEKIYRIGIISDKRENTDYEAGSGTMYIPVLGDLFPKLWGQEMRKQNLHFLKINGELLPVDKKLFDSVAINQQVKIYYSKFSETVLGIEKI